MGCIKKMQFEHFSGLLRCPKLYASDVENPGAILTFLPGTGYFFSNGFFLYFSVWLFYNKGNSLVTPANISCYRNA